MNLASIDRILTQQALITGRVTDGITGRAPLLPPGVELLARLTGGTTRRFPLIFRVYPDGTFVAAGDPGRAFPRLPAGASLDLRLNAHAAGYQLATFDFSLVAAQLTPTDQARVIDGRNVTVGLLAAPLIEHDFALMPLPVSLAGRVVEADAPETPVAAAQAAISAPAPRGPALTSTDGFFHLADLPVAAEVTVRIAKAGFNTLDRVISLDFGQPVNHQTFALTKP
jgi:hypothetical protein